jgi:hypothetical protein
MIALSRAVVADDLARCKASLVAAGHQSFVAVMVVQTAKLAVVGSWRGLGMMLVLPVAD